MKHERTRQWSPQQRDRLQRRFDHFMTREDWDGARRIIREALQELPRDHWLLSRLGLTFYEKGRYGSALECQRRALSLEPHCPLVKWELAGCLDMLGQSEEALALYRELSTGRWPEDSCDEGVAWKRGLIADALFRMAGIQERRGELANARRLLQRHLVRRRSRVVSAYRIEDVRAKLRQLAR